MKIYYYCIYDHSVHTVVPCICHEHHKDLVPPVMCRSSTGWYSRLERPILRRLPTRKKLWCARAGPDLDRHFSPKKVPVVCRDSTALTFTLSPATELPF